MIIRFYKYQGTGNDFIILDNRLGLFNELTTSRINFLCDRRFGIGADGLMLLNLKANYDFEMVYFNADGRQSSMCGNGGRCLVKFALHAGITKTSYHFLAIDGEHFAEIDEHGLVRLKMQDVSEIRDHHGDKVLDTGSPHYVKDVSSLQNFDVSGEGSLIRNNNDFKPGGINVNFVESLSDDEIMVRTFERGVEAETLSCGTGVTASALVHFHNEFGFNEVSVKTPGGRLSVEFERNADDSFTNIWLCGPAEKVFEGVIEIPE